MPTVRVGFRFRVRVMLCEARERVKVKVMAYYKPWNHQRSS